MATRLAPNVIMYTYHVSELALNERQICHHDEVSELLVQALDDSIDLPSFDDTSASQSFFKTQRNGHQDVELVKTGFRLHLLAQNLVSASESKWWIFWTNKVWEPLELTSLCDFTSVLMAQTRVLLTSPGQINYGGHMTPS